MALLESTRAEAIRSETARRNLLSDISHDIRTPLTSVIGYVDALRDGIAQDSLERDGYIDVISRKSRKLKAMIDDLFELAKLDAGDFAVELKPIDACEAAREVLIEFLPSIQSSGIKLEARIPDERLMVQADGLCLARILRNYLQNAIRHGGAGKYLSLRVEAEGELVTLSVADRGPGIPAKDLERVFDRLYRKDRARGGLEEGSGLGLAIVSSLAARNGAVVNAQSRAGSETIFSVSFRQACFVRKN